MARIAALRADAAHTPNAQMKECNEFPRPEGQISTNHDYK